MMIDSRAEAAARFARGRRRWMDDDDDMMTSQHESGHALVAHCLKLDLTGVSIEGGVGFAGRFFMGGWEMRRRNAELAELASAHAICRLAGVEAVAIFGGHDPCGRTDLAEASAFAKLTGCRTESAVDDFIQFSRRSARRILQARPAALIGLVTALMMKRSLDRAEIARIIEDA